MKKKNMKSAQINVNSRTHTLTGRRSVMRKIKHSFRFITLSMLRNVHNQSLSYGPSVQHCKFIYAWQSANFYFCFTWHEMNASRHIKLILTKHGSKWNNEMLAISSLPTNYILVTQFAVEKSNLLSQWHFFPALSTQLDEILTSMFNDQFVKTSHYRRIFMNKKFLFSHHNKPTKVNILSGLFPHKFSHRPSTTSWSEFEWERAGAMR